MIVTRSNVVWAGLALGMVVSAIGCSAPSDNMGGVAAAPAAKAAPSPAMLARGAALYKAHCVACHGEMGKGDGAAAGVLKPPPTDHTDRAYMDTLDDEVLAKVIQMGGSVRGKPLMPSNPQIRGDDLDALVAFTRSLSADD